MKHHTTQELFDYWTRKRGRRRAPVRSDIDPADIRRILADTFIVTADFVNEIRVRLAGTRICALFAREIKGEAFDDLWSEACREQVHELVAAVVDENVGVSQAFMVLPNRAPKSIWSSFCCPSPSMAARVFARLARWLPWQPLFGWIRPVAALELGTFRHVGALLAGDAQFGPAGEGPRLRHGFRVYNGGIASPTDSLSG